MELYTKEELNTLKKLIEETGNEETFKGTLESIELITTNQYFTKIMLFH